MLKLNYGRTVLKYTPELLLPQDPQVFLQLFLTQFFPHRFFFFWFLHLFTFHLSLQGDGLAVVVGGEVTESSGINVPVQVPRGTSETDVTSSGLMVPLVSIGLGWIFLRSDSIWPSSTWTPSSFGFPLNVNQSLQKALGLAASESLSQLSKTLCSSSSSHPEK